MRVVYAERGVCAGRESEEECCVESIWLLNGSRSHTHTHSSQVSNIHVSTTRLRKLLVPYGRELDRTARHLLRLLRQIEFDVSRANDVCSEEDRDRIGPLLLSAYAAPDEDEEAYAECACAEACAEANAKNDARSARLHRCSACQRARRRRRTRRRRRRRTRRRRRRRRRRRDRNRHGHASGDLHSRRDDLNGHAQARGERQERLAQK